MLDAAADGKWAHAALRWLRTNGNYYYDYGLSRCGTNLANYIDWSARNATQYRYVDLQVWADGEARRTVRAATF